ncbi:MAG: PilN domain-containing protein [Deltaproteobacteria bacterium]|nr:PilN domain-containing protein [Deltaproteobacteria bacterium]
MKEKVGDIDLNDEKGIKKLSAKIDFLNAVIYENNFSWSELFYSLEKASPRNVSIHSVKPSYESRKIKIAGLAKKSKDVATLVDNLEKTSFIKKSFLLGESEEIIEKRYRALSFNIEAEGDF